MAEKLKSESELFTLSICTNCDNAPIGEQFVILGKTTNLPDNVGIGVLTTYDVDGEDRVKIQNLVGQNLNIKTIIMTRNYNYSNNKWSDWV